MKFFGISRTTNPPTLPDKTEILYPGFDSAGRQLITLYQVRDLVNSASASPTYGAETTLLAGVSGAFLDLVEISCANTSAQAFTVNLRDATGGGIVKVFSIPTKETKTIQFPVPLPQNVKGDTWTVAIANPVADQPDPGVVISATFIKNI